MRIDKFLKETGIIKRRSVAKELLDHNHISANDKSVKASYITKKGDIIKIQKGEVSIVLEILDIPQKNLRKDERSEYIRILSRNKELSEFDEGV